MDMDKLFESASLDGIADNVFGVVNNSVSEVKEMQRKKVAENVQLVVDALKKIESNISSRYDLIGNTLEKRILTIKDGRDGIHGRDGRNGKDGKNGRDGLPGPRGADGKPGRDGADGSDGVSVTDAKIDFDGSLIISLSSGREINVGEVVAPALAEQIKVITNGGGTSQSVIDTLASLQAQITALSGAVIYKGLWNASTNTPTLTSSVGTSGNFYIVSVAGSTSLDGITNWGVGDWAIYNGTAWQRVEGGAAGNFTTVTASSLTSGRVTYAGASGLLQDSANLTFNGTTLTSGGFSGPLNGTVGATTPSTGAFTTLSATGRTTVASPTTASGRFATRSSSDANQYNCLILESYTVPNLLGIGFNGTNWCISPSYEGAGAYKDVAIFSNNSKVAEFLSTGLAVTGTLTSTLDATHYGVTVGRGGGAVSSNTVLGASAFSTNSTGGYSVAIGTQALQVSTAGYNTAVGYQSQLVTSTGQSNVSLGYYSLVGNTSGGSNTAIGTFALGSNTTASNNTAVGYQAGYLSTGAGNQCFGYSSGSAVTSGAKNVILGSYTGAAAPISATGSNYVVLSDGDGNIVASSKTAQTFALQGGTLSSGTGIAFPATQSASSDANTLDDYEEGTWSPTASNFTVTGTPTITGTYTKIGRVVYFDISYGSTGTIAYSTSALITLPFPGIESSGMIAMAVNVNSESFTSGKSGVQMFLDSTNSRFFVGNFTTTSAGQVLKFGGFYRVT